MRFNLNVNNTLFGKLYWMNQTNTFFFNKSYNLYNDYIYKDVFYLKNYKYKGLFEFSYENDTQLIISNIFVKNNIDSIDIIDIHERFETKLSTFCPIKYKFYEDNNLVTDSTKIKNYFSKLL